MKYTPAIFALSGAMSLAPSVNAVNINFYNNSNLYRLSCGEIGWYLNVDIWDYTTSDENTIISQGGVWSGTFKIEGDDAHLSTQFLTEDPQNLTLWQPGAYSYSFGDTYNTGYLDTTFTSDLGDGYPGGGMGFSQLCS